jgi:hypothetical protein
VRYFAQVRSLASAGFADSLGLAVSSLGWEARIELRRKNFPRAINLYLEQAGAGDGSALDSLRFAAELALHDAPRSAKALAANLRARNVITAYVISGGWNTPVVDTDSPVFEPVLKFLSTQKRIPAPTGGWHKMESPALLWLQAVEAAKVRDVESAEKVALAAYQSGNLDMARRWIDCAPDSPTAQWLKAKLLLRDGQVEKTAALLSKLARQFPLGDGPQTNTPGKPTLQERLSLSPAWLSRPLEILSTTQVLGELGALRLARREYVEALDALWRSGYTEDAFYVADRVLTVDELRKYVDQTWPQNGNGLRQLLAERLVRTKRFSDAKQYLGDADRQLLDQYLAATSAAHDASQPAAQRAQLLWQTAQDIVGRGYSVLFTPPEDTDWRIAGGLFIYNNTPPYRLQPAPRRILPFSADEQQRVASTAIYPDRTWYYRFAATDLAWEAAQLMPDNTDETAHVLWQAGTWIKYLDPKAADRFYKALVRRCGQTTLGAEADRRRWFPSLDEKGNIIPARKNTADQPQDQAQNP